MWWNPYPSSEKIFMLGFLFLTSSPSRQNGRIRTPDNKKSCGGHPQEKAGRGCSNRSRVPRFSMGLINHMVLYTYGAIFTFFILIGIFGTDGMVS
jgi:hypothetical protein